MEKNSVQRLYTDKLVLYHKIFNGLFRYSAGLKSFLRKFISLHPNMKVLDAGCGSGTLTKHLYEKSVEKKIHGIKFHGFDITPAMLNIFRQWIDENNIENIKITKADVLKLNHLPNNWGNYDLIISSAMLEYIPKDKILIAIGNLINLLKPNRFLIIFISRRNFLMKLLIDKWWKANLYKKKEIHKILRNIGLKITQFSIFPFPFSYLSVWGHIIVSKK